MYLWHNHWMTRCSGRLHSEKPTNFYNLMSQDMSGAGVTETLWCGTGACIGGLEKTNKIIIIKKPKKQQMLAAVTLATVAATLSWVGEKNTRSKSTSPCMNSTGAQRRLAIHRVTGRRRECLARAGFDCDDGSWVIKTGSRRVVSYTGQTGRETRWSQTPTVPQLQIEVGKNSGNTTAIPGPQCTTWQPCVENRCIHLIV